MGAVSRRADSCVIVRVSLSQAIMKFALCAFVVLAAVCLEAEAACNTAVCQKFYQGVYDSVETSEWNSLEKIENRIDKWCRANKVRPFDKMCYYIEGVKRKISKDLSSGAPAELACKRYAQRDDAICTLKEPRKLDPNMNLQKMRVKQLRELMQEFGVDCPNCLEKSDMVKRIQTTILKKTEL